MFHVCIHLKFSFNMGTFKIFHGIYLNEIWKLFGHPLHKSLWYFRLEVHFPTLPSEHRDHFTFHPVLLTTQYQVSTGCPKKNAPLLLESVETWEHFFGTHGTNLVGVKSVPDIPKCQKNCNYEKCNLDLI